MTAPPLSSEILAGLLDDAAVFPPGNLPIDQAVVAHLRHRRSAHAELVGPLVLSAGHLSTLAGLTVSEPLAVAVTVPLPEVAAAVAAVDRINGVDLRVLEVALPADTSADQVVRDLADVPGLPASVTVYVEVPRDARREAVLGALAGTGHRAKFRTGGVQAHLYPDEGELAGAVLAAVGAGVPFKATAGLHHALRNTDPVTGFEQHGFLNVLNATDAALAGAGEQDLAALLAERDPARVAARAHTLTPGTRTAFRAFGTCSIAEPITELAGLGLLPPDLCKDVL
jgi:hypothetical protein